MLCQGVQCSFYGNCTSGYELYDLESSVQCSLFAILFRKYSPSPSVINLSGNRGSVKNRVYRTHPSSHLVGSFPYISLRFPWIDRCHIFREFLEETILNRLKSHRKLQRFDCIYALPPILRDWYYVSDYVMNSWYISMEPNTTVRTLQISITFRLDSIFDVVRQNSQEGWAPFRMLAWPMGQNILTA